MNRQQGTGADGVQLPWGRRREQAMIVIDLVVLTAVLMALAVPHIWRKLTVHDAGRRARASSPRVQEP
jgi:hypothetical protein